MTSDTGRVPDSLCEEHDPPHPTCDAAPAGRETTPSPEQRERLGPLLDAPVYFTEPGREATPCCVHCSGTQRACAWNGDHADPCRRCADEGREATHEPVSIEHERYIEVRCRSCGVLWPCDSVASSTARERP